MYVDKELARKLLEKQNSERRKSGLPELEMEPDYVPASMEEDQKRRKMEKREERREQGLPSESEEEVESVEETRPGGENWWKCDGILGCLYRIVFVYFLF